MTLYRVDYSPKARKQLRAIKDARLGHPLKRAIESLAIDPRPVGALKLTGEVDQWRIRVGDWRVIYRIDDGRLVVLVVTVAPRGGVYRYWVPHRWGVRAKRRVGFNPPMAEWWVEILPTLALPHRLLEFK